MSKAQLGQPVIYYADGDINGVGLAAMTVGVSKFEVEGPIDIFIFPAPGSQALRPIRQVRHVDDEYLDDHPEDRIINGDYGGVWDTPEAHDHRRCMLMHNKKSLARKQEADRNEQDLVNQRRLEEERIASQVTSLYADGKTPMEIAAKLRSPVELIQRVLAPITDKVPEPVKNEVDPEKEQFIRELADAGFDASDVKKKLKSKGVKSAQVDAYFERTASEPVQQPDPWADAPARAVGNAPNAIPSGVNVLAGSGGDVSDRLMNSDD